MLPGGDRPRALRPGAATRATTGASACSPCARLEQGKGVEDLAIAAGLLAQRGVDVSVTFLGRGPMRPRLERDRGGDGHRATASSSPASCRGRSCPTSTAATTRSCSPAARRATGASSSASRCSRRWRAGCRCSSGDSGSLPEVVGRPESLVRPHDPPALADALEALARRSGAAGRARRVQPGAGARALRPAQGARAAGRAVPGGAGGLGPARVALGVAVRCGRGGRRARRATRIRSGGGRRGRRRGRPRCGRARRTLAARAGGRRGTRVPAVRRRSAIRLRVS